MIIEFIQSTKYIRNDLGDQNVFQNKDTKIVFATIVSSRQTGILRLIWNQQNVNSSKKCCLDWRKLSQSIISSTHALISLLQASGTIGKIILEALLATPDINVTVISRNTSDATFPPNVNVRKTDFSESDLLSAFQGQDAVVSAVGATAFTEQKKFIDVAAHAGVKRFIPSEFSSNTLNEPVRQLLPLFKQKKEVLDYLKSKESSGLTWTGIATALLFDWVWLPILMS